MEKQVSVFYSWQSDSPPEVNRNFIERAIKEALKRLRSETRLIGAEREVHLHKDTTGVAGSPPIASTILKRIEESAAIIADVTFVGESFAGSGQKTDVRLLPNPNVMLEYGYALRCHSHNALIGVMNTAFGQPTSLPFDLAHLRWPIKYCVSSASDPGRVKEMEKLVSSLTKALKLVLSNSITSPGGAVLFEPKPEGASPAVFLHKPDELFHSDGYSAPRASGIPDGAKAYLRVYPVSSVPEISTELRARDYAAKGGLRPLGNAPSAIYERNAFGCIVYENLSLDSLWQFTQLFLSREIWGVDALALNERHQHQVGRQVTDAPFVRFIPTSYVEEQFIRALHNYLTFCKRTLEIASPVHVVAGLTGIRGYTLGTELSQLVGNALKDSVKWETEVTYDQPMSGMLNGFFERVWENCGIERPPKRVDLLGRLCSNLPAIQ